MSEKATVPQKTPATLFTVDTPPFMHKGYTVHSIMRDTFLALMPALALSAYSFGVGPLRVAALSMATAVFTDGLCQKLAKRDARLHDGSALITGLLFACLLPAGAPWWLVITGSTFSIVFGRQVFGGLGANPLCPPLVGWAAMTISWPMYMDPTAMTLMTHLTDPLLQIKYFGVQNLPEGNELAYLAGEQLGGIVSTQVGAVLAGGLYLLLRKAVRGEIVLFFLLGVGITGAIYWYLDPAAYLRPDLYFLTGSTLFAAFFLATDPSSSPVGLTGMILYGLLGGALVVIIRIYGIYPDGAPFAVLLANLVTPLLDLIRPRPYGRRKL